MRSSRNLFGRQDSRPSLAVGRWPLCAIAVAGGSLLMLAPPAHAGHWVMSWRPDGASFSKNYGGSRTWADGLNQRDGYDDTTGRVERRDEVYFSGNYSDSDGVQWGSKPVWRPLKVTQKGSITVYLKWVQDLVYGPGGPYTGPFIPADKVVVLCFTGYAYAQARTPIQAQSPSSTAPSRAEPSPTAPSGARASSILVVYHRTGYTTVQAQAPTPTPPIKSEVVASFGAIKGTEALGKSATLDERTTDTRWSEGGRKEVRIPLAVPEGSTEVEYTFPLETKATTEQMDASDQNNRPSVNGQFLVQMQVVKVGVAITSDIDTSWKKWSGKAADLPDVYKQRDPVSHQLLNQPNDKAVLVAPNATDPSKSIWKIACLRDADGKMTVESAASWTELDLWTGRVKLNANSVGFQNPPQYRWSHEGGGQLPSWVTAHNTESTWDLTQFNSFIEFGSPEGNLPTSSFKVNVKDPNVSLDDSYSVKWRYPYEPYHKRPNIHQFTWRRALSDIDDGANFSLPGGNAESQQNPYQTEDGSFVPAARAGLGAADDAASLFPKGKDIAEILTKFGGKALDWYVEKNFPTKSQHFTTIGEAWGYSIQHQQSGNSEGDDPAPIGGLVPSNLLSKPDGWLKCTHQVFEIVHSRRENWDADAYNGNGFVSDKGLVNADEALAVTVEVAFDQVRP